mmetsp:Transcript_36995/g.56701  ORF Transcript_36995/g.56701 Transcript_36995/m.56701 type:complete len:115 (+) Transcript_36995:391-735(+)
MVDIEVICGSEGYHSGETGGIVPDTFRIWRSLLDRLDDPKTGRVCKELEVDIPEWKETEAKYLTDLCGMNLCTKFPLEQGAKHCLPEGGLKDMYLDNVWRCNLSVTGAEGLPAL